MFFYATDEVFMNWGAIGAISDMLAAFAVIISLVYLSVQI